MRTLKSLLHLSVSLAALLLVTSCSESDGDYSQESKLSVTKSIIAELNRINASDEVGVVGFSTDALQASSEVRPFAACSYSGFTCSANIKNIQWNGCTTPVATLTGGWTETFISNTCCTSFGAGCAVSRLTSPISSVVTFASGASVTTSTPNHNTYSGVALTGGVTSVVGGTLDRTITINGLLRKVVGPKGSAWYNHSLRTTTPISVIGSRVAGTRQISAGVIELYHNSAEYLATATFSPTDKVRWGNASCCYPNAGTITTTFSGSLTGTTTLKFLNSVSCGDAQFTDINGVMENFTLDQCE